MLLTDDGGSSPSPLHFTVYAATAGLSISRHQEELPRIGSGLALHFGGHLILFFVFSTNETNHDKIHSGTDHQLSQSGNSCEGY